MAESGVTGSKAELPTIAPSEAPNPPSDSDLLQKHHISRKPPRRRIKNFDARVRLRKDIDGVPAGRSGPVGFPAGRRSRPPACSDLLHYMDVTLFFSSHPFCLSIHEASYPLSTPPFLSVLDLSVGSWLDDSVLIRVTHANIKSFSADICFSLQMTVEAVKEKLWKKCGTSVSSMCLELYDDTGAKISDLSDSMRPFGFYSPQDGYRLHVIDIDPSSVTCGGWLEDTSLVEKYTISEEAYDKRDDTFRKFKEKLSRPDTSNYEAEKCDNYMEDLCAYIKVGDRCQVEPGERRGVVKFVGRTETLAAGFWVGVQYDEPVGKHDGMVKGKRYFSSPPLHGAMVRPDKVKVGDYPERDLFEEEEI